MCALDLISGLADGLGNGIESLVGPSNLLPLLRECMSNRGPDVRQLVQRDWPARGVASGGWPPASKAYAPIWRAAAAHLALRLFNCFHPWGVGRLWRVLRWRIDPALRFCGSGFWLATHPFQFLSVKIVGFVDGCTHVFFTNHFIFQIRRVRTIGKIEVLILHFPNGIAYTI